MTPETKNYLDKARTTLGEAQKIVAIGVATAAARSAYYEAFIIERTGKIARTHSGVRAEFSRLARANPGIDKKFTVFLAQAYMYKEISDYSVEPGEIITVSEAEEAILTAGQFLDCIGNLLMASKP